MIVRLDGSGDSDIMGKLGLVPNPIVPPHGVPDYDRRQMTKTKNNGKTLI